MICFAYRDGLKTSSDNTPWPAESDPTNQQLGYSSVHGQW